jgi:hypothetical protein
MARYCCIIGVVFGIELHYIESVREDNMEIDRIDHPPVPPPEQPKETTPPENQTPEPEPEVDNTERVVDIFA